MSHWAKLDDNNIVLDVAVGDDTMADEGEQFFNKMVGGRWVKTSYNTRGGVHYNTVTWEPSDDQSKALRFNYAGIGYTFDPDKGTDGAFIPAKPFDSWVLNEDTCLWVAPVPYPTDGEAYVWDEDAGDWVAVETPGA